MIAKLLFATPLSHLALFNSVLDQVSPPRRCTKTSKLPYVFFLPGNERTSIPSLFTFLFCFFFFQFQNRTHATRKTTSCFLSQTEPRLSKLSTNHTATKSLSLNQKPGIVSVARQATEWQNAASLRSAVVLRSVGG